MQLVIVESPAKAKTIEKYLGADFRVLASYGHVRDLPPRDGSVDPDDDFAMAWEPYADKAARIRDIVGAAKGADRLVLATDPDREGEAISWHVLELLKAKKAVPKDVARVTFNAITRDAVTTAMKAPRDLDTDLIDAYRARRALDYLVGFTLSPVLWRKLPGAKSAGRVQSVALRIVVDREREIEAFRAQEYWSVEAAFEHGGQPFAARLSRWRGDRIDRLSIGTEADARAAVADVEAGRFTVAAVETKPVTRNPPPPFTTSTLQQDAARKLGFSASHTMRIAQGLYEDGAITYMRTDGVQMDGSAISAARKAIADRYDGHHVPDKPRIYQTKAKNAQEAHEAIRPTEFSRDQVGGGDHAKLYGLIWKRAMASQMASARLERTAIDLEDATGRTALRATGQVITFAGFLALYDEGRDDAADEDGRLLPMLRQGDAPTRTAISSEQHFTQPPPHYSEATLVKRLEELGIGRPSTYAATLQVLKDRNYVRIDKNRFFPEESGRLLTAFLERFFERYVAYDYTASLEEELDDVSGGRADWQSVLAAFWRDFKPRTGEVMEQKPSDITAELDTFLAPYLFPDRADGGDPRACPQCADGRLALRGGKFGPFIACANYPECRYTRQFAQAGGAAAETSGPETLGIDEDSGLPVSRQSGRFGPFVQLGEGKEVKRASIPKDLGGEGVDLELALKLLSLPRTVGTHPETGEEITAAIGRFGPYLKHAGKYARLASSAEVFEIGMNMAVAKLADAASGARGGRKAPEPLRVLGAHPVSTAEIRVMEGRYGPYVTDGTTNATLPKTETVEGVSLEAAAALIDARAAAAPAKGKGRKAATRTKAPVKADGPGKAPAKAKAKPKAKAATKAGAASKAKSAAKAAEPKATKAAGRGSAAATATVADDDIPF